MRYVRPPVSWKTCACAHVGLLSSRVGEPSFKKINPASLLACPSTRRIAVGSPVGHCSRSPAATRFVACAPPRGGRKAPPESETQSLEPGAAVPRSAPFQLRGKRSYRCRPSIASVTWDALDHSRRRLPRRLTGLLRRRGSACPSRPQTRLPPAP